MWPRTRLDIRWSDIAAGHTVCVTRWNRTVAAERLRANWPDAGHSLPTLSVRSGLHLLLGELDWPPGSEVLMSALTIPDMARIVRHHGYLPVPVDLDLNTASPTVEMIEQAVTPATRGMILAHLFGTRIPLDDILSFATARGIAVLEDCAQAFVGPGWTGTDGCLASMFSFGTIKTSTALGGGLLTIRDEQLAAMAEATHAGWPVQWRYGYALRLARSQLLKGLAYRPPFAAFRTGCRLLGLDYDHLLNSSARGFSGKQLIPQIQQSPSAPLTRLVARRIRTFHDTHLARRTILGHRLLAAIGQHAQFLGHRGHNHTFWVFPVLARDPIRLIARLRKAGFDATQGESMQIVASPTDRSDSAATIRRSFPRIVYLPLYPDMPESDIDRMGKTVCEVESETS